MRKRDLLKELLVQFKCLIGPFGRFFRIFPHYGAFLNLEYYEDVESPVDLYLSLKKMDEIFKSKSVKRINNGVKMLLESLDWRKHLVACIAIIKMSKENQKDYYETLWDLYTYI